jgi:hypothetical protein
MVMVSLMDFMMMLMDYDLCYLIYVLTDVIDEFPLSVQDT